MGFKLRSGNKPNFRNIGSTQKRVAPRKSHSPLRQTVEPTVEEWNEGQKNKSSIPGVDEGRSIIEKDLQTKAYKDRLNKEIDMFGGGEITKAGELSKKSKGGTESIENPTSEQLLEIRQKRLANSIWNDPSNKTKEGGRVGYGMHDARRLLTKEEKKELGLKDAAYTQYMPSSNLYFNKQYLDETGNIQGFEKSKQLGIHEGTHAVTGGTMNMLEGTQSFLNKAKGGTGKSDQFDSSELAKPQEVYARYKSTQNFLQEQGIFDYQSGDKFTNEHVKKIEKLMEGATWENFREKGIPYDVFTFFGHDDKDKHGNKKISNKDMKTIFNNVASNEPDPGQITDDFGQNQTFA
tara:strand:- start:2446 stop:3492 length:1047 start_codon:yes stop_codon:yes gene_type:complete